MTLYRPEAFDRLTDTQWDEARVRDGIRDIVADAGAAVPFATVASIVEERCAACHSVHPTLVSAAPLGLTLDTPAEI